MKLQYCSDLHLEFKENRAFLKDNPLGTEGDILLLAGDIMPFTTIDRFKSFFDFLSENFELTYWIPGNHEYYHSDLAKRFDPLYEKIRSNVLLVNNYAATHRNIKLVLSTLWSSISHENEEEIKWRMNDFRSIKYSGMLLTPSDVNQLHLRCMDFVSSELAKKETERIVVVTHHVPTFVNYPAKYKGDILNEAFAVELADFIETSGIDYWIFGHYHENVPEFKIGRTKLITNQLGYVHRGEYRDFKRGHVITPDCPNRDPTSDQTVL